MTKTDVKNYQGPTTSRENVIQKYQNFRYLVFLNFSVITIVPTSKYGLNSCRYLNPEFIPPIRELGSLYFQIRHTKYFYIICPILFRVIDLTLTGLPPETRLGMQKCYSRRSIDVYSPRYSYTYREPTSNSCNFI